MPSRYDHGFFKKSPTEVWAEHEMFTQSRLSAIFPVEPFIGWRSCGKAAGSFAGSGLKAAASLPIISTHQGRVLTIGCSAVSARYGCTFIMLVTPSAKARCGWRMPPISKPRIVQGELFMSLKLSPARSRDRQAPGRRAQNRVRHRDPDTATEKPDQGEVLAVGPGKATTTAANKTRGRQSRRQGPVRQVRRPDGQGRRR